MQVNAKKEKRHQRISQALRNNLKKRKTFQEKIKKKVTNERFIRSLD